MKLLVLLLLINGCYFFAQGQDQSITIKVDNKGNLKYECFDGQKILSADSLNTGKNIEIKIDPGLKFQEIVVKDTNSNIVGADIHRGNKATTIVGNDTLHVLNLEVKFSDGNTITIPNIGKAKISSADDFNKSNTPANTIDGCKCDPKKDIKLDIKDALSFCPKCDDEDYFVYDGQCKVLYQHVRNGPYEPITDLKEVKFKYKKEFKVKVIHVNTYIKDVKVTAEDLEYESTAPALFNDIFGGTGTLMESIEKKYAAQAGKADDRSVIEKAMDQFSNDLSQFLKKINKLKDIRNLVFYQCCESNINCGEQLDYNFGGLANDLTSIQIQYNKLTLMLKNESDKKAKLMADTAKLNGTIKKPPKGADLNKLKADLKTTTEELSKIQPNLEDINTQLSATWAAFTKPDEAQLRSLVTFNKNYLKQNFTFSTPPIFPQGNRMKLTLNIDSRDSNFIYKEGIQPTDHQQVQIEGPVLHKWFVCFSSGPFVCIGNEFYQTNYEFQRVPSYGNVVNDTSKYMLTASGKTNPPVGLAGFAHFEKKFAETWGFGANLGVGLTIEPNPRLAYMVGPSFFIGDRHQFSISAGVSGMQVDVLRKDLYPDYLVYDKTPDLEYSKKLAVGGFISVTYTVFTFNNRNKAPDKASAGDSPKK
jgi:hypothetical protein